MNFLQDQDVPKRVDYSYIEPKKPSRKKWFFLLFILIFLGGCTAWKYWPEPVSLEPETYTQLDIRSKEPKGILKKIQSFVFSKDIELSGTKNDRVNILLLGMGGAGHDGPYLTDTMIIASVKPSTKEVAMISIPRDLGVYIPKYGIQKINHINAYGENDKPGWGAATTAEQVEDLFDIPIHYYIRLDFKAFEEIIDEVGGITVHVDRSFTDAQFPAENFEYQTLTFTKGDTKMNGETALQFARSRHGNNGEGSDFARAKRQQKVLLALKQKVLSFSTLSNPLKIHSILRAVDSHLSTNMDFTDFMNMIDLARTIDTSEMITKVFDDSEGGLLRSSFTAGGAFILEPKSGNFDGMKQVIEHIFDGQAETVITAIEQEKPPLPTANVEIQNATWRAGLAQRTKGYLQNHEIYAKTIGNTEERPMLESGIYKISPDAPVEVLQTLQESLHIPIKQTPPEGMYPPSSTTDILIILGEDYNE